MLPDGVPARTFIGSAGLTASAKTGLDIRSDGIASFSQVLSGRLLADVCTAGMTAKAARAAAARVAGRRWKNGDTDPGIMAEKGGFGHPFRPGGSRVVRESKHLSLESECAGENWRD